MEMNALEIAPATFAGLLRHADRARPKECCGVLVGRRCRGSTRVWRALTVENVAAHPEVRFEISPEALLRAQEEALSESLDVVGYYHSHPHGPAEPSTSDRADAWPGVSYVIVSVAGASGAEVRSWRLSGEGVLAEEEVRVRAEVHGLGGTRS